MKYVQKKDIQFPLMAQRPIGGRHLTPYCDLYRCGVGLFQVDATCSEDVYHPDIRAWDSLETFDYSEQERYWKQLLSKCPKARFCLTLSVASPPWWDQLHPEELQVYWGGRFEHSFQRTDRKTLPSLASKVWRRDACSCLRRFLGWLEESGWADRVWGIQLCYGITWEWGILGSDDFVDYSRPMLEYFRNWLRESYCTVETLKDSWADKQVSFETAEIPSPQERLQANGDFRVFPRDRRAYDFQRCLSDVNVDYLLSLAQTVRDFSKRAYKLGAFYGYTLTAREHSNYAGLYGPGGLQGGQHALERVLSSGLLDFISSPYAYVDRELGSGLLIQHYPLKSVQHHGLYGYDENDLRTFLNSSEYELDISVGSTSTCDASIQHQRLALGQSLCRGTSYWWTELTDWIGPYAPNYADKELLNELAYHVGLFEKSNSGTGGFSHRSSSVQIALVLDEKAIDAIGLKSKLFLREVYQQLPAWAWCGCPFDVWLLSDVSIDTMEQYKLVYVFAPYLDSAGRRRLKTAICHDGRTVWWGPYTGWLTDTGPDDSAFTHLTGFDCVDVPLGLPKLSKEKNYIYVYGRCEGFSARMQLVGEVA